MNGANYQKTHPILLARVEKVKFFGSDKRIGIPENFNIDRDRMREFRKKNSGDTGEEELFIYLENGNLFIETELSETHIFALNKDEIDDLIKVLQNLKSEVYK